MDLIRKILISVKINMEQVELTQSQKVDMDTLRIGVYSCK